MSKEIPPIYSRKRSSRRILLGSLTAIATVALINYCVGSFKDNPNLTLGKTILSKTVDDLDIESPKLVTEKWLETHPISIIEAAYIQDSQGNVTTELVLKDHELYKSELDNESGIYTEYKKILSLSIENPTTLAASITGDTIIVAGSNRSELLEKNPVDTHYKDSIKWLIAKNLYGKQDYWEHVNPPAPYDAPILLLSTDEGKTFKEVTVPVNRGIVQKAQNIPGTSKFILYISQEFAWQTKILAIYDAKESSLSIIDTRYKDVEVFYTSTATEDGKLKVYIGDNRNVYSSFSNDRSAFSYSISNFVSEVTLDLKTNQVMEYKDLFYSQDKITDVFIDHPQGKVYFITGTGSNIVYTYDQNKHKVEGSIDLTKIDYTRCSGVFKEGLDYQNGLKFYRVIKAGGKFWVIGAYRDTRIVSTEVWHPLLLSWSENIDPTKKLDDPTVHMLNSQVFMGEEKNFGLKFINLNGHYRIIATFENFGIIEVATNPSGNSLLQIGYPVTGL